MCTAHSSVGTLASFKGFNVFDCLFLIDGTAFPGFPESKVGNFLSAYNKHRKSHVQAIAVDKPPPNLDAQMLQKIDKVRSSIACAVDETKPLV